MRTVSRRRLLPLLGLLLHRSLLAQAAPLPAWITVDSAAHEISLALTVEPGSADSGASLNGFRRGAVQVVVPLNWTVHWTWTSHDSSATHSLVVMAEREKLPLEGGRPALENAMTRAVLTGLKPGQRDLTTFVADQAGWYWLLCGVPGHALRGEWLGLKIDRDATAPALVLHR
jgi:hypothetical protein